MEVAVVIGSILEMQDLHTIVVTEVVRTVVVVVVDLVVEVVTDDGTVTVMIVTDLVVAAEADDTDFFMDRNVILSLHNQMNEMIPTMPGISNIRERGLRSREKKGSHYNCQMFGN